MPDDPSQLGPGGEGETPQPSQPSTPGPPQPGTAASAQAGAQAPAQAQPADQQAATATPATPSTLGRLFGERRVRWAAIAILCLVAGIVISVLGARSVARHDASNARNTFQRNSAGIATALAASIQHDEDLATSASTFIASNPLASPTEFARWAKWAHAPARFPELRSLSMISLVRAPQLAAYATRVTGHKVNVATVAPAGAASTAAASLAASGSAVPATGASAVPASSRSTAAARAAAELTAARAALHLRPSASHSYFCLTTAQSLARGVAGTAAGHDYCARSHTLLAAGETGHTTYSSSSGPAGQTLTVLAPVYRGNVTPRSVKGKRSALVGWLREALLPGVFIAQALSPHPKYAVHLGYTNTASHVIFTIGTPEAGSQTTTINLHNGWTIRSFGPAPGGSIFADGSALALLLSGCLLSVLLALLVYLVGTGRAGAPVTAPLPPAREVPNEDLYDMLTGLPNRGLTLDRAERLVARAGRQSGMLAGALIVDIDWFGDLTEKLGRAAGDQLLAIVAERLQGVVRGLDTVGRIGDDEFVVLVESAARGVRLDNLAGRIIEALHKPVELDSFGPSFFFTASIGVAFGRYETPDDLLRDAQLALLAAKSAGKDRYTLFNANMRSVIEGRSVLEAELNAALLDHQFVLRYEPIYDLASGRVAGLEALIGWQHPKQGMVAREDFMPLAEETGLIVPIGREAMEEACAKAAAWNVEGPRVGISVKVSPAQVNREGIVTDVRRALQQSGLQPSLLTLQIAEMTVMRDVEAASERLQQLKNLGVRIAIDDFGSSGYAYHSDLRRLPLDALKVDKGSLAASEDEDYRSWLLEAILIVGRELSLAVVAKGIDSGEELANLQEMGCTLAQGSYMGEAVPAEGVSRLFASRLAGAQTPPAAPSGDPSADTERT